MKQCLYLLSCNSSSAKLSETTPGFGTETQQHSVQGFFMRSLLLGISSVHADMKRAALSYRFFGVRSDRFEAMLYVNNVLDNDTVRFSGGGPGLGCCFVLGSAIDVNASDPDADPPDDPLIPPVPTAAVMVDLPLFSTAFLPPPRVIGVRWSYRFGN